MGVKEILRDEEKLKTIPVKDVAQVPAFSPKHSDELTLGRMEKGLKAGASEENFRGSSAHLAGETMAIATNVVEVSKALGPTPLEANKTLSRKFSDLLNALA